METVAQLGYRYVELAGFFDHQAKEVKAWLGHYGLKCSGTHTSIDFETLDEEIAYHQAIGCDNLIVPVARWATEEEMEDHISMLNRAQEKLSGAGIRLGFHDHSRKFLPTPLGKIAEYELLARTKVEFGGYVLGINAGLDPVEFMEQHKDRIRVIQLKDGIPTAPNCRNYEHTYDGVEGKALGEGEAPIARINDWTKWNNVRVVVESEGLSPSGLEKIGHCIRFLRTFG